MMPPNGMPPGVSSPMPGGPMAGPPPGAPGLTAGQMPIDPQQLAQMLMAQGQGASMPPPGPPMMGPNGPVQPGPQMPPRY